MLCWGDTENGELGLGDQDTEQVFLPTSNEFGSILSIKQVACGLTHTLFLSEEGQVYSCGSNESGQLGHNKCRSKPEPIDAFQEYTITQIAAGDKHSVVLSSWGEVYSWGENGFGQLGLNSVNSHSDVPRMIKALATKHVAQICCGANHTSALTLSGELYAWGLNNNGQLGLKHNDSPITVPHLLKIMIGIPICLIKAGGQHSAALTLSGYLLTWGSNKYGQLGRQTDTTNFSSEPKVVPNLATYSEPLRYVDVGENHTAVLDSYGKLWTFGFGRYGQLGHGNTDDSSVPRPVLDLIGSKVSQVACGRSHTIVYIPLQGQLFAFGQGMSGQLGIKTKQNRTLPQCVDGPWRPPIVKKEVNTSDDTIITEPQEDVRIYIKELFAGGDASIATVTKDSKEAVDYCVSVPFKCPLNLQVERINKMLNLNDEDAVDDDLFTYCEITFGSINCWNGSFFKTGNSKFEHNLDFQLAEECLNKLGRLVKESLKEIVFSGLKKSFKDLPRQPLTAEGMRCYLILPLCKGFRDIKNALFFHEPFVSAVLALEATAIILFKKWLLTLPIDFLSLLVNSYKNVIGFIISSKDELLMADRKDENNLLLSSLKFLDLLYQENKSFPGRKTRIPYEEFYIHEITDNIDIKEDYNNWLLYRSSLIFQRQICFCEYSFLFDSKAKTVLLKVDSLRQFFDWMEKLKIKNISVNCEYSFLFDSKAKTVLLKVDSLRQMQGAVQNAVLNANPLMCWLNPEEVQFLTFHINRSKILQDTIIQVNNYSDNDLKRPLKIHFINEEAEDAGGVRKEFFLLLLREILNPDYGMFTQFHQTRTIWFSEATFDVDHEMFRLIGVVCGLAIYNSTIINLPFPLALYKKLLNEPVSLEDYFELDPTVTKSLRSLLEYEGTDVEEVFCLNFSITQDFFGQNIVKPLKPDGENISVTADNKQEYVEAFVDWRLNKSIEKQYKLFHDGFNKVCGGGILNLFQPMELMALVIGNENYDWNEFRDNAEYKGVFYKDHETIKLFWEVFDELSHENKKKFLLFLTGCDRIPILGMKTLQIVFMPVAEETLLPVAHTCVLQLDLPVYKTKEKLKYKLTQAIQQTEGFGIV